MKNSKIPGFHFLIKIVAFFFILMGSFSCQKWRDKGDYDYNNVENINITISSPAFTSPGSDSLIIAQYDTLKATANFDAAKVSKNVTIAWYMIQTVANSPNPAIYQLGSTKDLSKAINIQPGFYQVVFRLVDNETGSYYYKYLQLFVQPGPIGREGWVILQEQTALNGNDISVIRTTDGTVRGDVYHNVYSLINKKKLPLGTDRVYISNYDSRTNAQSVYFASPTYSIHTFWTDFSDSIDNSLWFLSQPSVFNIQNIYCASGGQYEIIFNNNQAYSRIVSTAALITQPILFGAPLLGSWSLSPFSANARSFDNVSTFYDQANQCFLGMNVTTGALSPVLPDIPNKHYPAFPTASATSLANSGYGFDMNNIKKKLLYAENAKTMENSPLIGGAVTWNWFFRSNTNDSTFIIQFLAATSYTNTFTTGRYWLNQANCPGINTASMFAVPQELTSTNLTTFYYVNANNVYKGSLLAGTQGSTPATLAKAFPSGTIIKAMKIFKSDYSGTGNSPNTPFPALEGKVLVIATDETASSGGNKVYFFNISTGSMVQTDVYTGFDKIVDIAFKKTVGK